MALLVCTTCPREDPPHRGEWARLVESTWRRAGAGVRHVACLGGCPAPGVVALDGPGKTRIRFGGLTVDDLTELVQISRAYDSTDFPEPETVVASGRLRARITSIRPKRAPATSCP